jgi:hypothetical protein
MPLWLTAHKLHGCVIQGQCIQKAHQVNAKGLWQSPNSHMPLDDATDDLLQQAALEWIRMTYPSAGTTSACLGIELSALLMNVEGWHGGLKM